MLLDHWRYIAPQAPWWIDLMPLLSALIGLIGGVVGVIVGAWLSQRLEARRWRLQQRNQALLHFAETADAYLVTVTRYVAPAVAGQNVTANQVLDAMFALSGAGTVVQMMSPQAIRASVMSLMNYVTNDIMPFVLPGAPYPVPNAQAETMLNGYVARLAAFVEVTRADFGEGGQILPGQQPQAPQQQPPQQQPPPQQQAPGQPPQQQA